jgi:Domain of unknown function (DUF932)
MKTANLILHCGASKVEREQLVDVSTPPATHSWTPIPHLTLVQQVEKALTAANMKVVNQAHGLTKEGDRYFGLFQINNEDEFGSDDYSYVLGVRNSHDKKFPAGLVVGSSVFVCDNLSFSGEIKIARKHTCYIMRDLPGLVSNAIGRLAESWTAMEERINRYKATEIQDMEANDFIIRAVDAGVMPLTQIPSILTQWRTPNHPEFAPRTAWSLFNAFTEAAKGGSVMSLPKRTVNLHGLMDSQCGFFGGGLTDTNPSKN